MQSKVVRYRAFLLRIWEPAHGQSMRAIVRDVASGRTHAFSELDEMTRWLERATSGDRLLITSQNDATEEI